MTLAITLRRITREKLGNKISQASIVPQGSDGVSEMDRWSPTVRKCKREKSTRATFLLWRPENSVQSRQVCCVWLFFCCCCWKWWLGFAFYFPLLLEWTDDPWRSKEITMWLVWCLLRGPLIDYVCVTIAFTEKGKIHFEIFFSGKN